MKKFFSVPVAVAAFLILSACNKHASQNMRDVPVGSESAQHVVEQSIPVLAEQDSAAASSAAKQPTVQHEQVAPAQRSYKAGAIQAYSREAYAEALTDGKTVVLDFHADWCPVCAANAPGIRAAFENTGNVNVVGFIANYDTETALENQFGVSMQSTIVKVRGDDPETAQKIDTLGPGPLSQEQVASFIQS